MIKKAPFTIDNKAGRGKKVFFYDSLFYSISRYILVCYKNIDATTDEINNRWVTVITPHVLEHYTTSGCHGVVIVIVLLLIV